MQEWFRIKHAANYADISERSMIEWLKSGLRSAKVKGCVLIKREWLDEFIEKHEVKGDQQRVDEIVNEVMKGFK